MKALMVFLQSLNLGKVNDTSVLDKLLAQAWDDLAGGELHGMEGVKLIGRMENVEWSPPILTFSIERHGGTVAGSTRAEVHGWSINLEEKTAECTSVGRRQIYAAAPRLDVNPLADEIAKLILGHQEDEHLRWIEEGLVRVHIGKILPEGSVVAQTLVGRRKRFRENLDDLLGDKWEMLRPNLYKESG